MKKLMDMSSDHIDRLTIGEIDNPIAQSAVLQLDSTEGAFIPTRLTQAQIDALTPVDSMIVYNTDSKTLQVRQNDAWISFEPSGVSVVYTGNGLTGGPITSVGTISLADTSVVPGRYVNPALTVDQTGRITQIQNGTSPQNVCFLEAVLSADEVIVGSGDPTPIYHPINFDRALTNKSFCDNPFRKDNQIVFPYSGVYLINYVLGIKSSNSGFDNGIWKVMFNFFDQTGTQITKMMNDVAMFSFPQYEQYPNIKGSFLFYASAQQSVQLSIASINISDAIVIDKDPSNTLIQIHPLSFDGN